MRIGLIGASFGALCTVALGVLMPPWTGIDTIGLCLWCGAFGYALRRKDDDDE